MSDVYLELYEYMNYYTNYASELSYLISFTKISLSDKIYLWIESCRLTSMPYRLLCKEQRGILLYKLRILFSTTFLNNDITVVFCSNYLRLNKAKITIREKWWERACPDGVTGFVTERMFQPNISNIFQSVDT